MTEPSPPMSRGDRRCAAHFRAAITLAVAIAACGAPGPSPDSGAPSTTVAPSAPELTTPTAAVSPDRETGWRMDLEELLPEMEAIHPDLYHGTPRAELAAAVDELIGEVPSASDDELLDGVLRIVAMVSAGGRDGHTGAFIWGSGSYPVHSMPLRLWQFSDGMYIVDALPPYEELIGARLDSVAGTATAEIVNALDRLIPRDNPTTVVLLAPRFMLTPEVLHGLGLIDSADAVELGITDSSGAERSVQITPITMADYNGWAGPYGLHLPPMQEVTYLSDPAEALWWTDVAGGSTFYVQYNRVVPVGSTRFDELKAMAGRDEVDRVVIDIRHNFGGETAAYKPLLDALINIDANESTLYLVIGRNTFSAASLFAAEVERETNAIFVGEPMGGSPNLFGDPSEFTLPFSGIAVSVAGQYYVGSTEDDPRLTFEPDLATPLSAVDYFAGIDPVLEAILAGP
jgi:hypothetical protein